MESNWFSCGLDAAMTVVDGKWKPLILWELHEAPRRYGELRRLLPGISEKVMIQQLRQLQTAGLVDRVDFGEVPPRVQYSLTELGEDLNTALLPLGEWGERHQTHLERLRNVSP